MLLSVWSRHWLRQKALFFAFIYSVFDCALSGREESISIKPCLRFTMGLRGNYFWSAILHELANCSRRSIWCIWLFVANYCKQVKQIWKIIFEGMWPRIFIGITRTPEKCLLSLYHDCTFKNWRGGLFVFTVLGLLCREKLEQLCFCFMQMEIQRSVTMAQQTIHSWRLAGEWCTPRFSRLWKVPVLCQ